MLKKITLFLMLLLILGACAASPSSEYVLGDVLIQESFASQTAWETYVGETVELEVVDGAYRVQTGDEGYIWGLNDQSHGDVVIEASASQLSSFANNAYGVMCRADTSNNGDGYYFMVSGDGYYSIREGDGDDVNALVDWTTSSVINEGQSSNVIKAVCIGDYLALFVNDKFIAEANDSSFSSGYAGFAATAFDGGTADISFDDTTIWSASLP